MVNKTIKFKPDVGAKPPKFDSNSFFCRYITKNLSRDGNKEQLSHLYVF